MHQAVCNRSAAGGYGAGRPAFSQGHARDRALGYFSPSIKPACTIKSGDLVQAEAITHHAGDAPDLMFDEAVERIFTEIDPTTRAPGVHIMTGPIYVEGPSRATCWKCATSQMVPRNNYGSNLAANWGHLYQEFDEKERVTIYRLDAQTQPPARSMPTISRQVSRSRHDHQCPVCDRQPALPGVTIPARPHLGTAGVAPAVNEPVSTIRPPRRQHRQLAHRRGRDDVLQVPGQGRAVLDRRSPCQPGRRRDFGHGDRKLAQLPVPDHPAQGFRFPSPLLETPKHWIVHGFGDTSTRR
jgi:hypothetical protein